MNLFIEHLLKNPAFYFTWLLTVVFSICLHEFAHAYAAKRCGDDTAMEYGYMTMNPLRVMGLHSLICLLIFGIAWGKVPVNDGALRKNWHKSWVSFAGPFANLLLIVASCLLTVLLAKTNIEAIPVNIYIDFLITAARANAFLFVFNLLPIPMLDGWSVLEPFSTRMQNTKINHRELISFIAILTLWTIPWLSKCLDLVSVSILKTVYSSISFIL